MLSRHMQHDRRRQCWKVQSCNTATLLLGHPCMLCREFHYPPCQSKYGKSVLLTKMKVCYAHNYHNIIAELLLLEMIRDPLIYGIAIFLWHRYNGTTLSLCRFLVCHNVDATQAPSAHTANSARAPRAVGSPLVPDPGFPHSTDVISSKPEKPCGRFRTRKERLLGSPSTVSGYIA